MKIDSKTEWPRILEISVQAALALVVLGLVAIPVAIQAELKNLAVLYTWDFAHAQFEGANVVIPWDGTWLPFLHELNFDLDVWADPSVCGYDPAEPDTGTPWAGDLHFGLYHVDDNPPGVPGFQESRIWSLISCDRNQDGSFDSADLIAPPSPYDRPVVYAECSPTGDYCRVESSEQDVVTDCTTGNCLQEIVTRIQVNLDLDCDGVVDPELGIPTSDPWTGAPEMLCFYAEARTPTLAEQADLVWLGPLQARISLMPDPIAGDRTVSFVLAAPGELPSAAFTASSLSGMVPLTVTFSDQSSGSINTWLWEFGDGTSSTEENPTHVYEEIGSWDVTLMVFGPNGGDVELKPDYIETGAIAPVISGQNLSNVRDMSFAVSWITELSSKGYLEYGTTTALGQVAEDVRGGGHNGFTHYVDVVGLQPETTYYFDIVSGSTRDDNGGAHYTLTTGPTLGPLASDTAYGKVYQDDGTTPAEGAIVLITLMDRDGSGDSGSAAVLSSLVDGSGTWTADLGYASLPDLSGYFQYSPSGDTLFLEATGGPLGDTCLYEDTGTDSPAGDITLGDPCVVEAPIEGLAASNDSTTPLGNLTTFTATVSTGSDIDYAWAFGDGGYGIGEVATYTYPAIGIYTAVVTASNSVSSLTATTLVTVTERSFCEDVTEIPEAECEALVAFYNSTDGPHWLDSSGWMETNTPCTDWHGVECSAGHVTELVLYANELGGSLPPELGSLTSLQRLGLDSNQLGGEIPPELGELGSLQKLELQYNRLTGHIPAQLRDLTNLQVLWLHANALEGDVPATIANLVALDPDLTSLGYNMLSASDPAVIGFLHEKDPDWADTQTVPPADLQVTGVTPHSVQLSWTPISYTGDDGYYEVSYATTPGGPDAIHVPTSDKTVSGYLVDGLATEETYYFVLRTYTPAHDFQQNELWSSYSDEVSATPRVVCQARVNDDATVYNDVQSAVDAAIEGDLVKVAGYCPGVGSRAGITQTAYISKTITLRGGYTTTNWIMHDPESNPTTLDAQGLGRVLYITGEISPTIEGLRITGGDAYDGAGIYVYQASATISNSMVYSNTAAHDGGGMYNSSSSLTVNNCTFSGNRASNGGGMSNSGSSPTVNSSAFSGNHASRGGGMCNWSSSPRVTNVIFEGNSAGNGGGMYSMGLPSPILTDCVFSGNSAGDLGGGGMFNDSCRPVLTNCTFSGNFSDEWGGGMLNYMGSSPVLANCSFSGNSATAGGGIYNFVQSQSTLTNCILWADIPDEISNNSDIDLSIVAYSDVQGGHPGVGNLDVDPLFTDPANGDLHLGPGSPCVDAGDNTAPDMPLYDFEGDARIADGDGNGTVIVDMGADEVREGLHPSIVVFVDQGATGSNDGTSWADAFTELQPALDTASSGMQIWVAEGTYMPSQEFAPGDPRSATFQMKNGVTIYGGFAGTETVLEERDWEVHETILSGDLNGDDGPDFANNDENSYHVFYHPEGTGLDSTALLDGFMITGGNANVHETIHGYGGGMYNSGSSPTLVNCTLFHNQAWDGGGMYNSENSSPALTNCTFSGNWATRFGGGIDNESSSPTLLGCTFTRNSGDLRGGGMYNVESSPMLTDCTFEGNTAEVGYGGGMYNDSSSPTLINCSFTDNSAREFGGGVANEYGSSPALTGCTFIGNAANAGGGMVNWGNSSPVLTDCNFSVNSADDGGGMVNFASSPTLTKCTFWGNSADRGGGMFNFTSSPVLTNCSIKGNLASQGGGISNSSSSPMLTNCTFWGNSAADSGGGMFNNSSSSPGLTNSILWANSPNQMANDSSSAVVAYSDIQGGCDTIPGNDCGGGNINADPLFIDAGSGDFHLGPGSPCIDAGASYVPDLPPYDFEGDPRILDGDGDGTPTVDMGVDEVPGAVIPPGVIFVDQGVTGTKDGTSWADAFTELQPALEAAVAGEQIWVAEGTYKPTTGTDRSASFQMKNGVAVYGGFAGMETVLAERAWVLRKTILSGDLNEDDGPDFANNDENSYHVFYHPEGADLDNTAVLDGFTISGGNANGSTGGGMYNVGSSPTLANITFEGNSAGNGGGMSNMFYSSPILTNCSFLRNFAGFWGGGGMHNDGSAPVLIDCSFSGNSAIEVGGGILNYMSASPTLINCSFWGNSAEWGGGMANAACGSPKLTNCTFSGNSASGGGGMYNGACSPVLTNSILWGDTPDEILNQATSTTPVITYSNIQGGCETIPGNDCGEGNIDVDPLFVDWGSGDFHLRSGSPCIDAGTNDVPNLSSFDFEGDPRIMDGDGDGSVTVDMGVDEATHVPPGTFCDGVSEIPTAECEALVAFYNSTDGPHWSNGTGWLVTYTPCTDWHGVTCSAGHVIGISMPNNQLSGLLPPEIGDLANLNSLDLSSNGLSGEIPLELGQLANLETLRLGANQLSGELPPELGDLVNLEDLWLYNNRLSGSIPTTLEDLASLQVLRLDANRLSGGIPAELAKLSSLYWLDLAYNMLVAEEPTLLAFLSEHDPDWAETQTVPPTGLGATAVTSSTVELSWSPISYTSDGGYYEVSYSTVQGGPYTVYDNTADKEASGYLVDGLFPDMPYYFVLRTYTPSHVNQQNELWSWNSEEASAATPAVLCDPVSTVQLSRIPAGDLYAGTTVYFSAIADGTAPLTYTWTLDGVPVDEDRSTYDYTFESEGAYTVGVTVSNACGESEGTLAVVVEDATAGLPDLSLSQKTASLTSVESGDLLTYTLLLRNASPVEAAVDLTDAIPQYTTYVAGSAHASDAGAVTLVGDELLWAGQVISGTPVLIEFAVDVQVESAPLGTRIVNTAYLEAGSEDAGVLEATSTYNPGYRLTINDGADFTKVPTVTLSYAWNVDDEITHVKFSNDGGFVPGENTSDWLPVDPVNPTLEDWLLDTYGDLRMSRTVYARFRDSLGNQFGPFQDDIVFDPDVPAVTSVEILEPAAGDARALAESEVIVRVTSSDSNTGVSMVQIAENASFDSYLEFPVLGPTTDIPWVLQGSSLLYVRVVDRAGNLSVAASAPTGIGFKVYVPVVLRSFP